MIMNDKQMAEIIAHLLHKSRSQEVFWNPLNGEDFLVEMEDGAAITLAKCDNGEVDIKLVSPNSSIIIGEARANFAEQTSDLATLYKTVKEAFVSKASDSFKSVFGPGVIGRSVSPGLLTSRRAALMVAPKPTNEQITSFFGKIAGRWALNFSRGREVATIDSEGRYFVGERREPKFVLKLLAASGDLTRVEIAKDTLDKRRFQIEVLRVSDNEMTGEAKHDQHKLIYRRQS